jgi:hypothetical protein
MLKKVLGVVFCVVLFSQTGDAQETEVIGKRFEKFYDSYKDRTPMKVTQVYLSGIMRPMPDYAADLGLSGYYGLDASIGSSDGVLDNNELTFVTSRSTAMKWADEQEKDAEWFGGGEEVSLQVTLHGMFRCIDSHGTTWWIFFVSRIDVIAADGTVYATVK